MMFMLEKMFMVFTFIKNLILKQKRCNCEIDETKEKKNLKCMYRSFMHSDITNAYGIATCIVKNSASYLLIIHSLF